MGPDESTPIPIPLMGGRKKWFQDYQRVTVVAASISDLKRGLRWVTPPPPLGGWKVELKKCFQDYQSVAASILNSIED